MPVPLFRVLIVSFYLLAEVPSTPATLNAAFVQASLVQGNLTPMPLLCSKLPEKGGIGPKSRDLNIETPQEAHHNVQARLVQRPVVHQPVSVPQESSNQISEKCLSVMFWNVENFFDWRNDSTTVSDAEFSSRGERRWTWKRFQAKANAFAKALFWIEGETGRLPDIIGLEEVENAFVLRQLLQKTALRKLDYKYVHYDSPDRRGIDVALLYRTSRLELLESKPCHLFSSDTLMATRDILLCVFKGKPSVIPGPSPSSNSDSSLPSVIPGLSGDLTSATHDVFPSVTGDLMSTSHDVIPGLSGDLLEEEDRCPIGVGYDESFAGHDDNSVGHDGRFAGYDDNSVKHDDSSAGYSGAFAVLVNHHPSKYGGAAESEPRRRIAVERLRFLVDSLATVGIDHVIAGGDFNDTPDNPVFRLLEPALIPMHMDLYRRGLGTIKYDGKWDLIDHIYVSPILVATTAPVLARMRILRIPFLLARDTAHSGEKPLRTFQGPRILGGVSDHLPILLEVALPMDKKGGSTPGKGSSIPSERISPLVKGSPAPGEPP